MSKLSHETFHQKITFPEVMRKASTVITEKMIWEQASYLPNNQRSRRERTDFVQIFIDSESSCATLPLPTGNYMTTKTGGWKRRHCIFFHKCNCIWLTGGKQAYATGLHWRNEAVAWVMWEKGWSALEKHIFYFCPLKREEGTFHTYILGNIMEKENQHRGYNIVFQKWNKVKSSKLWVSDVIWLILKLVNRNLIQVYE